MLLNNYNYAVCNCGRNIGAQGQNLYGIYKPQVWYNAKFGDMNYNLYWDTVNFPRGTQPPYSVILALKGGEMEFVVSGSGDLSAVLTKAKNLTSDLSGSGDLTAAMGVIMKLTADLSGSGDLTANMGAIANLSSNLSGSGDLVVTALNLIVKMTADLYGSGDLTAIFKGIASMSSDIYVNESTLTAEANAKAVWSALSDDNKDPGSMGELLFGAGGGSSPSLIADAVWNHLSGLNVETLVTIIAKLTGNKVSKSGNIITIYEDDETTPWRQYDLSNGERIPL